MVSGVNESAIRTEGLVKRYGDLVALGGVDLEVERGTIFGLLGPNGAGKTTAVRILSTILRPDGGRAEVLGKDVVRQAAAVRRRIGLAGQNAAVDPNLTGRENLRMVGILGQMPGPMVVPRAAELLAKFDLTDAADRPLRTYSGGMRRRLDIAASLMTRPPVLFLDEPTTGLDLTSRNALWEMIEQLVAEGTTVLLTTQYLEEADRLAGRIAVVDGGKVIANDTPQQLKAQLGSTVVEMRFLGDGRSTQASQLLSGRVAGRVERDDGLVRITAEGGAQVLVEALRMLDADGLEPDGLTVREPSLDDVFLSITGHHAEPTDEEAAGPAAEPQQKGKSA
jgi:daunorubicin resistance ABC transporter ATP-binding subunit